MKRMNKIHRAFLVAVAAPALLSGCAKEPVTQTNFTNKLFFDAWVQRNHPSAAAAGNGIYILDDQPGTGAAWDAENDLFAYLDYTVTDLEGVISATTSERLAKKVGSYSKANYYGPRMQLIMEGNSVAGLDDALKGMRVGGTRTVAIPSWLQTTLRYGSAEEYLAQSVTANDALYTVTLRRKIADGLDPETGMGRIYRWEADSLEKYVAVHMHGVDSTWRSSTEEGARFGFYYDPVYRPDDEHLMPRDTTFKINYTGRLLNGRAFDTTIAKVAKDNDIYSTSRTYEPVSITMSETLSEISMDESSSLLEGFRYALAWLHPHEKAVFAFYSQLGYSYSGSGSTIPPFSPLVFEIEVVD